MCVCDKFSRPEATNDNNLGNGNVRFIIRDLSTNSLAHGNLFIPQIIILNSIRCFQNPKLITNLIHKT